MMEVVDGVGVGVSEKKKLNIMAPPKKKRRIVRGV